MHLNSREQDVLIGLQKEIKELMASIKAIGDSKCTKKTKVNLLSLLYLTSKELEKMYLQQKLLPEDLFVILTALNARNIFELYLKTRYVLKSESNSSNFSGEESRDFIECCEGKLELLKSLKFDEKIVNENEEQLKKIKKTLPDRTKKIPNICDLAKLFGKDSEYKAFYKVYCKYIHPTLFGVKHIISKQIVETKKIFISQTFYKISQIITTIKLKYEL
jgi:hypothetical protein